MKPLAPVMSIFSFVSVIFFVLTFLRTVGRVSPATLAGDFLAFAVHHLPPMLLRLPLKLLHIIEALVVAVQSDEFVVCAALHNLSFVEHTNLVGVFDC